MFKLAFGYMDMSESDFWNMEPRIFWQKYRGWSEMQQREWERERFFTLQVVQSWGEFKKPINSPQDWIRFPWEEKPEPEKKKQPFTKEQLKRLEKWDKLGAPKFK